MPKFLEKRNLGQCSQTSHPGVMSVVMAFVLFVSGLASGKVNAPPLQISKGPQRFDSLPEEFHAIGRLLVQGVDSQFHCTATLIASDVILTAKHCLFDDSERPITTAVFQPAYPYVSNLASSVAVPVAQGKGRSDWALLRLETRQSIKPLPIYWKQKENLLTLVAERLMAIGYSTIVDGGEVLSYDTNCTSVDNRMNVIYTTCQFSGGGSGGPLLSQIGNKWMIVGVLRSQNTFEPPPGPQSIYHYHMITPLQDAKETIMKWIKP